MRNFSATTAAALLISSMASAASAGHPTQCDRVIAATKHPTGACEVVRRWPLAALGFAPLCLSRSLWHKIFGVAPGMEVENAARDHAVLLFNGRRPQVEAGLTRLQAQSVTHACGSRSAVVPPGQAIAVARLRGQIAWRPGKRQHFVKTANTLAEARQAALRECDQMTLAILKSCSVTAAHRNPGLD